MEKGLISIIIPAYNHAAYIGETLHSVLGQEYGPLEVIVVDDGSTDSTKEVVAGIHDPRITYLWQENSGLPAAARNRGLERARGEYIAFLDSDDLWLPHKLRLQVAALEADPKLSLVASDAEEYDGERRGKLIRLTEDARPSFRKLLSMNTVINSTVLMRANVARRIGPLDTDPRIRASEDYDYWLRVLRDRDNSVLVLKEVLARIRVHADNISNSFFVNGDDLVKKVAVIYAKYPGYDPGYLKENLYVITKLTLKVAVYKGMVPVKSMLLNGELRLPDRMEILAKYWAKKLLGKL
jgi:glycosyltransferase involved in cell wall biosynthesis